MVRDSPSVDLSLTGDGSEFSPWTLSADARVAMSDIRDLDETNAQAGYVVARKADGSYHLAPAATTAPGAISAGDGVIGDGSAGAPLSARLAVNSGLTVDSNGLAVETRVVNSQAELNAKYANVPNGTLVAKADGTVVWSKIASGWTEVTQDKASRLPVDALGGPYTSASWWDLPWTSNKEATVAWPRIPKPAGGLSPDVRFVAPAAGVVMAFGIVNGAVDPSEVLHTRFRVAGKTNGGGNPFYGRIAMTTPAATSSVLSTTLCTTFDVVKDEVLDLHIQYCYQYPTSAPVASKLLKVTDVRINALFIPLAVEINAPANPDEGNPAASTP